MTWLAGWLAGLWSNIFIIGLSDSHIFHPAPSTSLQYWSYLSVYLHTASIIYHPAQSLRPRQDNVDVLLVTSQSVQYINTTLCPLLCRHSIAAAPSAGTFCQIVHQLAEFLDNFPSRLRMEPYLTRLTCQSNIFNI